ncbi:MAG TPA: ERF family protein [Terriglobales bacterium]|nr:ERF family protein [Terriglobales bacterium]
MTQVAIRDENLPETRQPTSLLEVISRAASDPNTDVEKLERLMMMMERVEARNAERAFNEAMGAAQEEIKPVAADASNPQTKSKYASYPALDKAIRPIYTKHGFALSFDTGRDAPTDHVRVLCYVSHKVGHSRTYQTDMPADGKGAKGGDVMTKTHAAGSAMSYGQRYLLKLIFNIAVGDDDDGNAGGNIPITEEQLAKLSEMMEQADADPEKFCKYMKVEALKDITTKHYGRALEALNLAIDKRQQKGKGK